MTTNPTLVFFDLQTRSIGCVPADELVSVGTPVDDETDDDLPYFGLELTPYRSSVLVAADTRIPNRSEVLIALMTRSHRERNRIMHVQLVKNGVLVLVYGSDGKFLHEPLLYDFDRKQARVVAATELQEVTGVEPLDPQPHPGTGAGAVPGADVNLARIIYEHYPEAKDMIPAETADDLKKMYAWATEKDFGDALLKFIIVEAHEGGEDEEGRVNPALAYRSLRYGLRQLQAVVNEIARQLGSPVNQADE